MGAQIDQKSIPKWSPRWNASWHRFLSDFGGLWEPSWDAKSSQDRSKMASKKRRKNEAQQDDQKGAIRNPNGSGPPRPGPQGGIPLIAGQTPPPTPPPFSRRLSLSVKVLSCLVFLLTSLVLSCPVLCCPVLSCRGSIFLPNFARSWVPKSIKI